jgi:hypothetical protein
VAFSKTLLIWTDPDSGEGLSLQFDAITQETKDDSVEITDHPVEAGSNVADNARDSPALLTIEALISGIPNDALDDDAEINQQTITVDGMSDPGTQQVPLDIPPVPIAFSETGLIQAGVGALVGLFSGAPKATLTGGPLPAQYSTSANMLAQGSPRNRGRDVYEKLLLLKSQHVQLDLIQTAFRDYPDMMISRLSQPRAVGDGTSAKFQIDFKQIRIATSQTVAAPKPSVVRANAPVKKGSQGTKPADKEADKKSLAKDIEAAFVGFAKKFAG